MQKSIKVLKFSELKDRIPAHSEIKGLDLVVIRYDDNISVLYGRCLHRGALLADGHIEGKNLICGVHGWDYCVDTGVSEYNNDEVLYKFATKIEKDIVWIDEDEIDEFLVNNPQPMNYPTASGRSIKKRIIILFRHKWRGI